MLKLLKCIHAAGLAGLLLCASTNRAQVPDPQQLTISKDSTPSPADLQTWLHSGDPRLVAWAAWFAGQGNDVAALRELTTTLPTLPGLSPAYTTFAPEHMSAAVVLDVLIRQQQHIPANTIDVVSHNFPAQAVLLAARLPAAESAGLFETWYFARNGSPSERTLARAATLLQAEAPPPALVRSIVRDTDEHLVVTVASTKEPRSGVSMGGVCGDSFGSPRPQGWPSVFAYSLEENGFAASDNTLVEWPGERLSYQRHDIHAGFGSCNGLDWLDTRKRLVLIAHWLGVAPADVGWPGETDVTLQWTDAAHYTAELGRLTESTRRAQQQVVQQLVARKLLTPEAARYTGPGLRVTVICAMEPCPIPDAVTQADEPFSPFND